MSDIHGSFVDLSATDMLHLKQKIHWERWRMFDHHQKRLFLDELLLNGIFHEAQERKLAVLSYASVLLLTDDPNFNAFLRTNSDYKRENQGNSHPLKFDWDVGRMKGCHLFIVDAHVRPVKKTHTQVP